MGFFLFLLLLLVTSSGALSQRAEATPREAHEVEVATGLVAINVYGAREHGDDGLSTITLIVEQRAGSTPTDMKHVLLRYSDGVEVQSYVYAEDDRADGFGTTWIRGSGLDGVAVAGDLVELEFAPPTPLATRTSVSLTLIPETGPAVMADFKTPPTYGTDLVVTLR